MRNYNTRKPSGQPSWPLIFLAGMEGTGKTWAAAEATGMEAVGRAFFLEIGESMADEYINVPGANYEVIEHNGTFNDILGAVQWAASQPVEDGAFNLLVVDSLTELWTLLTDEAQEIANRRRKPQPGQDSQITMDLWNRAKARLEAFWEALRTFHGPVLATARLELVTVVGSDGKPTGLKEWKVRCQKDAPFRAQVIVQARKPQEWTLTKIASTRLKLAPGGEMPLPEFSVAKLLGEMGIDAGAKASTFITLDPSGERAANQQQKSAAAAAMPENPSGELARLVALGDRDGLATLWRIASAHGEVEFAAQVAEAGRALTAKATA